MYKYSQKSLTKLNTCHPDIQKIFKKAIQFIDITILEGQRSMERQEELVRTGMSQTMNSKHLKQDDGWSHAVDAALWPVDWNDKDRFVYLGGFIIALAEIMYKNGEITHKIRWGGDWDSDQNIKEHSFFDGPHFEIYKPNTI